MRLLASAAAAALAVLAVSATPAEAATTTTTVVTETNVTYPTAEVGVYAGVPTGLSGKYWLSPFSGLDMALSWRFPKDGYSFNADYLVHSYVLRDILQRPDAKIPLYAGAGFKALHLSNDPVYGARFPLGVNALLDVLPISLFAEIAPGVIFKSEGPQFNADAGVGARVYF